MLTGKELTSFRKALLRWFFQFQRDLPWRKSRDPYRIWISEVMLQQTRVAAVIPYYERFLARFPDVRALAEAPTEEVLRWWSGLGYYSRAKNLQRAAQKIVELHGGEFPRDADAVRKLPGIGDYTGAAIRSIAFGSPAAVLDGNVARVLARLGAIRGDLQASKRWKSVQQIADGLLDRKAAGPWNQAMMELGATVCTPRSPQCLLCPVAKFCRARKTGDPERFPEKRAKRATVEVALAAAVFLNPLGETMLLPPPERTKKNPADIATLVSGMRHFPVIVVKKDARKELREFVQSHFSSVGMTLELEPFRAVRHCVTYRNVTVVPFRIAVPELPAHAEAKILSLSEVNALPVSNLTRKIARAALAGSKGGPSVAARPRLMRLAAGDEAT